MKRIRLLTVVGSMCLVLMLLVSLLAGCAPEEEEVVTPAEEEEEEVVAPAEEEEVFNLIFHSSSVPGQSQHEQFVRYMGNLERMSGGRIEVEILPQGTMGSTGEFYDMTKTGMIDCMHTAPTYWQGVVPCGYAVWGLVGGPKDLEGKIDLYWYNEPSMSDIFQEASLADGIYALGNLCASGAYGQFMSTFPINHPEDVDGHLVRSYAMIGDIWESYGASLVTMPSSEIYTGIALGTIDAMNYGPPKALYDISMHEVTSYFTTFAPANYTDVTMVNLDWWNSLPADLQEIFTICGREYMIHRNATFWREDQWAMQQFVEEWGMIAITWTEEEEDEIREKAWPMYQQYAEEHPDQYTVAVVNLLGDYMGYQ